MKYQLEIIQNYLSSISKDITIFQYDMFDGKITHVVIRFPLLGNLTVLHKLKKDGWKDGGSVKIRTIENGEESDGIKTWYPSNNVTVYKKMELSL